MRERILGEIKRVEAMYNVRVCYAVEAGSRAWGFPSKESDYDVRFIYVEKKEWYLSIDPKRDVIELPINNLLDINGWELRKALRLFKKSNPPLMEWLQSEIVYYQAFSLIDRMRSIQELVFEPKTVLYHYLNMARRNYRDYLHRDQVRIKKYFYVLRPILACLWIERYNTVPPIEFRLLVEELVEDKLLKQEINTLVKRKISSDELNNEPKIMVINHFVEEEIYRMQEYIKTLEVTKKDITLALNVLFRETLIEVWS